MRRGIPVLRMSKIERHGYGDSAFETTEEYWDCECVECYIHPVSREWCSACGVFRPDQPDSRVDEVVAAGIARVPDEYTLGKV